LFPDDREIPPDAMNSVQVKLSGLELRRPRMFGHCWLACELWQQLGLDEFWQVFQLPTNSVATHRVRPAFGTTRMCAQANRVSCQGAKANRTDTG
jgi:hypothetical protein